METIAATESSAPYGRSCTNCSKAKCRCIYNGSSSGSRCERCRRLNRECVASAYARKRTPRKPAGSRTAQLEQKLDDLVSILKSQTATKSGEASQDSPHPVLDIYTPPQSTSSYSAVQSDASPNAPTSSAPPFSCPDELVPGDCHSFAQEDPASILSVLPCPGEPPPSQSELFLDRYRTQMSVFLPLVHLPVGVTSQLLRRHRPFLWLCIMYVACDSLQQQALLAQSIKQIVATKVVLEEEKSLDILLGLLVFLGWMQFQPKGKRCLGLFVGIAHSLVYDLGLHEQDKEQPIILAFKLGKLPKGRPPPPRERTMDERRAVLATFLLSSSFFTALKRLEPLKWTSHMDEYLQFLEGHAASDSDVILAGLVKLQLITEQVHRAPWQSADGSSGQNRRPPQAYVDCLLGQLKRVRNQVPQALQDNGVFMESYHYTELRIHELSITKASHTGQLSSTDPDYARFACLDACLQSLKCWFDVLFAFPRSSYIDFSFPCYAHFAHCLITLHKLTALDDTAWDRGAVRRTIDLFAVCDRILDDLNYVVSHFRAGTGDEDLFLRCLKALRSFRSIWWAELGSAGAPDEMAPEGMAGAEAVAAGNDALNEADMVLFADDAWLTDIFNHAWE